MGRKPSVTFNDFVKVNPDWENIALAMFEEGDAEINVIVRLGITRRIHLRFCVDVEEYGEIMEMGKERSESWWVSQGKKGLTDKTFQTGFYAFCMKNRFGWRDTPLSKEQGSNPLNDKDDEQKLVEKYSKEEVCDEKDGSAIQ